MNYCDIDKESISSTNAITLGGQPEQQRTLISTQRLNLNSSETNTEGLSEPYSHARNQGDTYQSENLYRTGMHHKPKDDHSILQDHFITPPIQKTDKSNTTSGMSKGQEKIFSFSTEHYGMQMSNRTDSATLDQHSSTHTSYSPTKYNQKDRSTLQKNRKSEYLTGNSSGWGSQPLVETPFWEKKSSDQVSPLNHQPCFTDVGQRNTALQQHLTIDTTSSHQQSRQSSQFHTSEVYENDDELWNSINKSMISESGICNKDGRVMTDRSKNNIYIDWMSDEPAMDSCSSFHSTTMSPSPMPSHELQWKTSDTGDGWTRTVDEPLNNNSRSSEEASPILGSNNPIVETIHLEMQNGSKVQIHIRKMDDPVQLAQIFCQAQNIGDCSFIHYVTQFFLKRKSFAMRRYSR